MTADRVIDTIFDRFELLVTQPQQQPARVRRGRSLAVVGSYVIYYRHEREILIARVVHGSSDQVAAWSE